MTEGAGITTLRHVLELGARSRPQRHACGDKSESRTSHDNR